MIKNLFNNIKKKKITIAIIGLGYVGLPLAHAFANRKFNVIGIDTDKNKINSLRKNKSYIERITNKQINKISIKHFKATTNFNELENVNAIIYCLPTPLKENKEPDMSFIKNAINKSKKYFKKNQIISLESTTYPGTTEDYFLTILIKKKFIIGENFFLIYSPEREDPGNNKFNISNTPKIVSGYSENCKKIGKILYSNISKKIHLVDSIKIAEMTKIFENVYRSVNISLVNELKIICNKMNVDVFEIIKAAKTKPFGFNAFYPGPGLGGHCIPIDPFLLSWKAKHYGVNTKFIELSGKINEKMPFFVYENIKKSLKKMKVKKTNSNILLLGAAYKKNIKDTRETPFLKIAELLIKNEFPFEYNDPYVSKIKIKHKNIVLKSKTLNYKSLGTYDMIVIITDHDMYNYQKIMNNSKLIIDTRGRYKSNQNKIVRS